MRVSSSSWKSETLYWWDIGTSPLRRQAACHMRMRSSLRPYTMTLDPHAASDTTSKSTPQLTSHNCSRYAYQSQSPWAPAPRLSASDATGVQRLPHYVPRNGAQWAPKSPYRGRWCLGLDRLAARAAADGVRRPLCAWQSTSAQPLLETSRSQRSTE